jgi:hypothetical protein
LAQLFQHRDANKATERIHEGGNIDESSTTAQTLENLEIETHTAKVEQTFGAMATGNAG